MKKQVINYLRTRETFRAYKASGYSKRYLAEHEQDILLHRAAKKAFNDLGLRKLPTVKTLQAEYAALLAEKRATYPAYREARAEMKKLLTTTPTPRRSSAWTQIPARDKKSMSSGEPPMLFSYYASLTPYLSPHLPAAHRA